MMTYFARIAIALFVSMTLTGCASVDQFGSRIYDANVNSQTALDQETLLNVIRASHFQNINFVAITQITGGQTEAVTTGFPTFTTGPHAAPTVITNSLASGISGGYQSNPLVSSQFEEGILSPITPRALAQLLMSQSREPVLYAVMESIKFDFNGKSLSFANDPSDDVDPDDATESCRDKVAKWDAAVILQNDTVCRYSKFENFLGKLLEFGFSAELKKVAPSNTKKADAHSNGAKPADKQADKSSDADKGTASNKDIAGTLSRGRLCFDPALATRFYNVPVLRSEKCGLDREFTNDLKVKFDRFDVTITPAFRSLAGIYAYLGNIERNGLSSKIQYYSRTGLNIIKDDTFLNIKPSLGVDCSISISYELHPFCVPYGADNTRMIFSILQQIRNLSIQPSDLNSAFTVRLTNG